MNDLLEHLLDLGHALEHAWWKERRGPFPFDATPEQVTAMQGMREGRAIVDFLLSQSPAMIFMIAALVQMGRRRRCTWGEGDWLDEYIELRETLQTPRQAVATLLERVWEFHYALEGLDMLQAQGVDLDQVFGMRR
jgi:hypothetical protein